MLQQVGIELKPEVEARLGQLPSATTIRERQLALFYAGTMWHGKGDVFENGPLLGGSTRALALGMLSNEKRDPETLLHTYDWFSLRDENPLDLQDDVWSQLISSGLLSADEVTAAQVKGTFLPLFKALHQEQDYWNVVRPHVGYLPGHRDDVPKHGEAIFEISGYGPFSLAFIDGCKSWYGTKHWFRELLPHLAPETDIMFQDFGHRTCFWLPALIATFRESFDLIAYVDYTYIWRLHDAPSQKDFEKRFPDEPSGFTNEDYDGIFDGLLKYAYERNDRWAVLVLQMQKASAYAYIGIKDEARRILDGLLMQSEWMPYRTYLKEARRSPTYTPEGEVEL